jgi:16S rRNA (uracil1498-N3)-methyltransferase
VRDAATTAQVVERVRTAAATLGLLESADRPLTGLDLPADGDVLLVVGPEGGLTDDELRAMSDAGGTPVRLGPGVLRTSTAGAAAVAVVSALTDRWG